MANLRFACCGDLGGGFFQLTDLLIFMKSIKSLTHHLRCSPLSQNERQPRKTKFFHLKNLVCQNYDENYLESI